MKTYILDGGLAGTGIIDPCNNNFNELYTSAGSRMSRFLNKLNTPASLLKDDTIRICLIGDSISGSYALGDYWFFNIIASLYPDVSSRMQFKKVSISGTGSDYMIAPCQELINWNPDLVFWMEFEGGTYQHDYSRIILKQFREKTSADICIVPWSMYKTDMQYLYDNDIVNFRTTATYAMRGVMMDLANEFNAEWIDWHRLIMKKLWNKEVTTSYYFGDGETVHPLDTYFADANEVIENHFIENLRVVSNKLFLNNYLINRYNQSRKHIYFFEANDIPGLHDITKSGTWTSVNIDTSKTYDAIQSSDTGAYLETKFNGIGFELAYYGSHIGEFGILVDGVALSTLLKDYFTQFTAVSGGVLGSTGRPFAVIINSHCVSDATPVINLKLTVTSNNNAGNIAYTLYDNDTSANLGTGNFNTDSNFNVGDGTITIPQYFAKVLNAREDATHKLSGSYYFSIAKNWYDSVTVAADSTTRVIRVFGLENKQHTIRITRNSGTITLDSLMELK